MNSGSLLSIGVDHIGQAALLNAAQWPSGALSAAEVVPKYGVETPGTQKKQRFPMITDVIRVIGQLPEKRLLTPVLLGLVLSALVIAGLVGGAAWLLSGISVDGDSWVEQALDAIGLLQIVGTLGVGLLALFLFPAFALTIQSFFLDGVADAVERKHYPQKLPARSVPLGEALQTSLTLTAIVIAVNLVLLPVYLLLMLVPPTGYLLYLAVNGYLVGREFYEVVGLRHEGARELKTNRRRNRVSVWLDGVLLVFIFTIPIVNLAGPTLGTAYFVHRYHRLTRGG